MNKLVIAPLGPRGPWVLGELCLSANDAEATLREQSAISLRGRAIIKVHHDRTADELPPIPGDPATP